MSNHSRLGFLGRISARFSFWHVVSLVTLGIFLLFLVYPVLSLFFSSFTGGDSPAAPWYQPYEHLVTRKLYYESLRNSFILGGAATIGALALGVPLAFFVSRLKIPGKVLVRSAIVLTFVSPPFIGAYAWVVMFGQTGIVRRLFLDLGVSFPSIYGWGGTILVLSLQGMPYVFLFVTSGLKTVDQSVEDAGINLGYPRATVARTAILPLLKPAISTAALLVFVTAFTDVGTPMVIGQNLRVFPRLVYQSYVSETSSDYRLAASLAVVMLVIAAGALLLQRRYAARRSFGQTMVRPLGIYRTTPLALGLATGFVYLVVLLACVPLLVVIVSSFLTFDNATASWSWTFENYLSASRLGSSFKNTVVVSTIATLLCVIVGTLAGYVISRTRGRLTGAIDLFSMIPFAVAGVIFGIAFSLAFGGSPFFLSGTVTILVIAYFIRRLPFSVRSTVSQLAQMGTQTEEASVNLGVPPGRTFLKITFPMLLPAVASGALLTWATVVKEFNATLILYGPWSRTMPIEIFQQIMLGDFESASVVGSILILLALVPIVVLFLVSNQDEEVLL